ncbi:MAG: sulfate ABC transporter permease subunit CysT [Gaiellaceae bacterium]
MASTTLSLPALRRPRPGAPLALGFVTTFLSLVVLLPVASLVWASGRPGWHQFWSVVSAPEAVASLKLTLGAAVVVSAINAVVGTITAWVLVRDDFVGKSLMNAVIDLPFALPTIVGGLTLLTLYGPASPLGVNIAYTRTAIVLALLFETLPFVVRTVQPVLHELDREAEQAARSLGASEARVFRSIVLPNILPGILSGVALAFARAVGEIGAIVLISGNLPFRTEVAAVFVFNHIQSGDQNGAAAVALVMLTIAFLLLLAIGGLRYLATRHERDA